MTAAVVAIVAVAVVEVVVVVVAAAAVRGGRGMIYMQPTFDVVARTRELPTRRGNGLVAARNGVETASERREEDKRHDAHFHSLPKEALGRTGDLPCFMTF